MNARKPTLSLVYLPVILTLLLLLGINVVFTSIQPVAAVGEPTSAHVESAATYTLFEATPITQTGTTYTASPNPIDGAADASLIENWASADLFIVLDGTGYFTVTATPQFSADGINWANADYEYVANTSTWTSEGITSTATSASAIATQAIARTMYADGVEYMRFPVAGRFMRVALATQGAVTPTVQATYRN